MGKAASEFGASDEDVVFLKVFEDLPDGWQAGKVRYPLTGVLLLYLPAVLKPSWPL